MNVQTSTETSKWVVSSVNSKQHSTLSCKVNTAQNRGTLKLQPFCPHTCKYYFGTFLTTAYVFYMQFTHFGMCYEATKSHFVLNTRTGMINKLKHYSA